MMPEMSSTTLVLRPIFSHLTLRLGIAALACSRLCAEVPPRRASIVAALPGDGDCGMWR